MGTSGLRNQRTRETVLTYHAAYGRTPEGRWAFARLLQSGGLLRRVENEEQRAAHNHMISLLENMGLTQGRNESELYDKLADMLLHVVPADEAVDA